MNRGKVRQPGTVVQRYLDIDLIRGARHASYRLSLAGDLVADRATIVAAVGAARAALAEVADDPHLLIATDVRSTREVRGGPLPAGRGDRRRGARVGARHRSRRPLRRRARLRGIRQLARPAQLARGHDVQPPVEPLSPRRQGGEVRAFRLRVGRGRVRRPRWTTRGRSSPTCRGPAKSLPPGKYRAFLDAGGDGGDRVDAVLGRILGARARDQAEQPHADAGRQRRRAAACPRGDDRRGHRRGRRAGVPGRRLRAAGARAADRSGPHWRARWHRRARRASSASRANGANGAEAPGIAGDGGRRAGSAGRAGGARHRPLRRQPALPQLLRPARVRGSPG